MTPELGQEKEKNPRPLFIQVMEVTVVAPRRLGQKKPEVQFLSCKFWESDMIEV